MCFLLKIPASLKFELVIFALDLIQLTLELVGFGAAKLKSLFDPKKPPVVVVFVVGTLAPHIPIFEFGSPNFVFVLSCLDTPK